MKLKQINEKMENFLLFNPIVKFMQNLMLLLFIIIMFCTPIAIGFLIYAAIKQGVSFTF